MFSLGSQLIKKHVCEKETEKILNKTSISRKILVLPFKNANAELTVMTQAAKHKQRDHLASEIEEVNLLFD